jgi:hypothetical protein
MQAASEWALPLSDYVCRAICRVVINDRDAHLNPGGHVSAKQAFERALEQFLAIVGRYDYV